MAIADDAVWVAVAEERLVKIDPVTCETLFTVSAPGVVYPAVGLGSVWVPGDSELLRFDESTGELQATITPAHT